MFASALSKKIGSDKSVFTNNDSKYEIITNSYGKNGNKVLYVSRNGNYHSIKELEVSIHLKLKSAKDYMHGDCSDIVGSDAQENTVFLLAKKYGIKNPEEFGLLLTEHFLKRYSHVVASHCHITEYPWNRLGETELKNSLYHNQNHNHVFITNSATPGRFCDVIRNRDDPNPLVMSGIKGLQMLKTTQSSFTGFIKCEYGYEGDTLERVHSLILNAQWQYSNIDNLNFCMAWNRIRDIFLKNFAGNSESGVLLKNNQNYTNIAGRDILDNVPQISAISIEVPNKSYIKFDTKNYQSIVPGENNEVFLSKIDPHSSVHIQLNRTEEITKNGNNSHSSVHNQLNRNEEIAENGNIN